ncbi:glycosyltransferase family 4 protein [Mycolicibacterium psychrotolerans]|nr:glycosyltransferase family 4 protein [Mycolicibacterium psychrotolerans]
MDALNKVSVASINYPPEPTGIAPYTGALARGLAAAGYSVTCHVAHPHYPEWKIRPGYGQWTRSEWQEGVRVLRRLHLVARPPRGVRRLLSELSFGVRLVFARWRSPDAVIAVSPSLFSTALAVLRLRLMPSTPKLIVWVQDLYSLGMSETGEGGWLVRRVTRGLESKTLAAADVVVVIHERFANYAQSVLGVRRSKIVVLRNWTHLPHSDPVDHETAKAALGWPGNTVLAVHTGNMGAKQGLENVVDAARLADERADRVHFILVGDGGERLALERRARGITRLSFVDPLEDEDYRLALQAADVLIVNEKPGVAAMAVPSKLTSYFDAGRPVVAATDCEGITASEVRAAGAGEIVRAGEAADLLEAVLSIAANADVANQYGANGRRYRETVLDQSAAMRHWLALVAETLKTV